MVVEMTPPDRSPSPIQRVSLIDSIEEVLSAMILNGEYPAGASLREADLCSQLEVSRQSLRVALARLAGAGLIDHEMNRGYRVPVLTPDATIDIFEMRELLEVEAVRRLATHGGDLSGAWAALADMEVLTEANWYEYHHAHFAFHSAIVEAAGSPRLRSHYSMLSAETRLSLIPADGDGHVTTPQLEVTRHRRLIELIEAGVPDAATAEATQHIRAGLAALPPALQRPAD